eukprot:COSAG05_NODE_5046_length_1280_cov_6.022862_4_plen_56_part_01
MTPKRLYIDSMYWSLTTMTTIGYGDRGPQTQVKIIFVIIPSVISVDSIATTASHTT